MTVSSTVRIAGPFIGNGSTDTFPFTFKVFSESDIVAISADAAGLETPLTLNTDFTVSLNVDQDNNPGGDVVLAAPLADGYSLAITSDVGQTQNTDIANGGAFFPGVINKALDKLTICVQEAQEKIDRSVKMPITSGETPDAIIASLNSSVSAAASSAVTAATKAGEASTSAGQAATSATAAAGSASSASLSAATATTQAGVATTKATESSDSAALSGSYTASIADALLQFDGWTGIRQIKSADGYRAYTSITNPTTRYTDTVSTPDVYGFQLDQTQVSVMVTGRIFNATLAAGQSIEVIGRCSGTGFGSASGLVVGFSPTFPGDLQALNASFVGYNWRSGGSLLAYGPDGSTTVSGNAPASGTAPAFVSGDTLKMKITRDATGSGGSIRMSVNGGTETVVTVPTLPSGAYFVFAGMRASPGVGQTSTGNLTSIKTIRQTISSTTKLPVTATPLRFRGIYNPNSTYAPHDCVVAGDGRNWECVAPCSGISPLSANWASYWRLRSDIWPPAALPTFTARTVPTPFGSYPFYLSPYYDGTAVTATLTKSVMDTFASIYSARMTGSAVYVDGTNGNDGQAGTTDAPMKTIQAAMTKNPTMVYIAPGTYDPFYYRDDTHSAVVNQLAGGVVKWLRVWDRDTDTSKRVTIKVTPPETLASKTWSATGGGHTDVYQATITTTGSQAPHRVLRTDTVDSYGFQTRLLKCTSLANLDAQSQGWYWDSVGKVLYIKMGSGVDVEANKGVLEGLWLDSGGNSRIFLYGTVLALDGDFYLKGIDRVPLCHSTARAESWTCGVTSFASANGACRVDGGWVIAENERGHASNGDHLNGNPSGSIPGLIVSHRCYITDSGDHTAFQLVASSDSNRNAISAHGGCDHISVGTVGELSYGPVFADTSTTLLAASSWLIGCVARSSLASLESGNGGIGFVMQGLASAGDAGNRTSWLDGCVATGNSLWGGFQSTNGTMKQTGCSFSTSSGTITSYSPGSP